MWRHCYKGKNVFHCQFLKSLPMTIPLHHAYKLFNKWVGVKHFPNLPGPNQASAL